MPIKLTYWDVRGLGESSRHLLRYTGEPWEDNPLPISPEGFGAWIAMKDAEDMPFGNLPFIDDDGKKVTQSLTVLRYLGKKFNLFPTNPDDVTLCEIVEQELVDLRDRMSKTCYDPYNMGPFAPKSEVGKFDFDFMKKGYRARLSERIPKFEKMLTKPFLLGDRPVYLDFLMYEFLDAFRRFIPEPFEGCENIIAYMKRFQELPNLKEWFESDKYKEGAYINGPIAVWHGKDQ